MQGAVLDYELDQQVSALQFQVTMVSHGTDDLHHPFLHLQRAIDTAMFIHTQHVYTGQIYWIHVCVCVCATLLLWSASGCLMLARIRSFLVSIMDARTQKGELF